MKLLRILAILIIAYLLAACSFSLAADVTPPPGYQPPPVENPPAATTPVAAAPVEATQALQDTPAVKNTVVADITSTGPLTSTVPLSGTETLGSITGLVTEASGVEISAGLTVTLHGFDQMQIVVSGTTTLNPDGSYVFQNIDMPVGRMFLTTLLYQGVTYGSEVVSAEAGKKTIDLPIKVYETTTDPSGLVVDRLHFFFDPLDDKTLRVIELYVISNPGNQAVVPAGPGQAVLKFSLPAGATNLEFQDGALGDRYLKTPDGFGDTAPIRPGQDEYQVLFSYQMPYAGKLDLIRPVSLPVNAVVILVSEGAMSVKGPTLQDGGTSDVQGTAYHMYNGSALPAGGELRLTVTAGGSSGISLTNSNPGLLIGLGVLGAVLIVAGVWFYLRDRSSKKLVAEAPEAPPVQAGSGDTPESIMDAILALDDLHQEGQLPEDAYRQRRAELKEKLKGLMNK